MQCSAHTMLEDIFHSCCIKKDKGATYKVPNAKLDLHLEDSAIDWVVIFQSLWVIDFVFSSSKSELLKWGQMNWSWLLDQHDLFFFSVCCWHGVDWKRLFMGPMRRCIRVNVCCSCGRSCMNTRLKSKSQSMPTTARYVHFFVHSVFWYGMNIKMYILFHVWSSHISAG